MASLNFRYVIGVLGVLLLLMSAAMTGGMFWSVYEVFYQKSLWRVDWEVVRAFGISMGIGVAIGTACLATSFRAPGNLGRKEALLVVGLAWFVGAALAALPFWIWANQHSYVPTQDHAFESFINCYFEAMSGLTTTGASVLKNIETVPRGLLFWRAFTQWLGGLGIVVIFVAVLPGLGAGTKKLFKVESSGISNEGVTPHMRDTARALLWVYLGLSALQILIMKGVESKITWFDAITHTFATLSSGGYSTHSASAGAFSPATQWVILVFMIFSGVNFALYGQLVQGRIRNVWMDTELRAYLGILLVATLLVGISIYGKSYTDLSGGTVTQTLESTVRDAGFQVTSIQTTTGFATVNYSDWGLLSNAVLIALMFIGGSGGSTAGGIKVIRILSAVKIMWVELERAYRPHVLRPVKVGHYNVEYHQRISILAYVLGIFVLFCIGTMALLFTERFSPLDGTTVATAVIATLNNIGPGFGGVGPVENYGWFSDSGKAILSVLMALGRLEVFAVLVILMPSFWRSH